MCNTPNARPKWTLLLFLIPVWGPPIWDSESERIGKQKCTPLGATLHSCSDLLGLMSQLSLPTILAILLRNLFRGTFQRHSLWLLLVPYLLTNIARFLYSYSWKLADRKGFRYGDDRVARWIEDGQERTFKYEGQSCPEKRT